MNHLKCQKQIGGVGGHGGGHVISGASLSSGDQAVVASNIMFEASFLKHVDQDSRYTVIAIIKKIVMHDL